MWKNKKERIISDRTIEETIKEAKNNGVVEVRFHGQEPTLHPNIGKFVTLAKKQQIKVGLKTNANLEEKRYAEIKTIDTLYLSIDSCVEEIHNKLRGNAKSFHNNRKLAEHFYKKLGKKCEINSVVTNVNYESHLYMPEYAAKIGAKRISFVLLNNKNRKEIEDLLPSKEQLSEFFFDIVPKIILKCESYNIKYDFSPFFAELVNKTSEEIYYELKYNSQQYKEEINNYSELKYGKTFYEKYGCFASLDHSTISYDGNYYPCCVIERDSKYSVGNIRKAGIEDIWNSTTYAAIRNSTISSNGKCCPVYEQCGSMFSARKRLQEELKKEKKQG
jgi:radical SAM protein with 4Fe4S-binding SPASM domain